MKKFIKNIIVSTTLAMLFSCAQDRPYLAGHIRRAHDAVMTTCDPYNTGVVHSCVIFSSAFKDALYVYDATAGEMVLAPNTFFPLKVKVGHATTDLVTVESSDKKFPFLLAIDRAAPAYFPIRLFANSDESEKSFFGEPKAHPLKAAPTKAAAVEISGRVVVIMTFAKEGRIEILSVKKETGAIDTSIAPVKIDTQGAPSHVVIDQKTAVVSDEKNNKLHVIKLETATKEIKYTTKTIDIAMPSDRINLSRRDFGDGMNLYALVTRSSGKVLKVINITKEKVVGTVTLDAEPMATYFPDDKSATCCSDIKHWFSVVTLDGKLTYVEVKLAGGALSFEKIKPVLDLTSEENLSLSKVHIVKILGGAIERDPLVKRERLCKNGRETFFIASFGNTRSYLYTDSVEAEAHGYSCEGENAVSRFGYKSN